MAVHAPTTATAELDLWVPRDAMGDLESGVRRVVADVDGVAAVTLLGVTDVTPRSTDIRVTATVEVELADTRQARDPVAATLADGFGVIEATDVTVR